MEAGDHRDVERLGRERADAADPAGTDGGDTDGGAWEGGMASLLCAAQLWAPLTSYLRRLSSAAPVHENQPDFGGKRASAPAMPGTLP